jgi:hypothetical protein
MSYNYRLSGKPSYITVDFGHQVGQRRFLRPDDFTIRKSLMRFRSGEWVENLWLGSGSAHGLFFYWRAHVPEEGLPLDQLI